MPWNHKKSNVKKSVTPPDNRSKKLMVIQNDVKDEKWKMKNFLGEREKRFLRFILS